MAEGNLILICAFLIITQLVVVHCKNDDIDFTTMHDDIRKMGKNFRKMCIGETGITEEALYEAELGDFKDKKLACYLRCIMDKGGLMKKDGNINFKLLDKMMNAFYKKQGNPELFKQLAQEILSGCRDIKPGNDKCDIALEFNQCIFKANPVAFFII